MSRVIDGSLQEINTTRSNEFPWRKISKYRRARYRLGQLGRSLDAFRLAFRNVKLGEGVRETEREKRERNLSHPFRILPDQVTFKYPRQVLLGARRSVQPVIL